MAFTDNCDLYAAVNEAGINRIAWHVMRQRPSLFNYASPEVASSANLWCQKVDVSPDVLNHHNPIFDTRTPLPVLGADSPPVLLNYCVQLTKAEIDFHPGNVFNLPGELNPPLSAQHVALHGKVCAGFGCPIQEQIQQLPPGSGFSNRDTKQNPVKLHTREMDCFCLDFFAVGHATMQPLPGGESLSAQVEGVDIVDIKPDNLEESINCYLKTTMAVLLREKLNISLTTFLLNLPMNLGSVQIFPTPNPPIAFNPSIDHDQLKAFATIKVP
jgi:hypothetical protein